MEERILEYLDAVEALLAEHGGQIAETLLVWARIDAASGLICALGMMICGGALMWFGLPRLVRTWERGSKLHEEWCKAAIGSEAETNIAWMGAGNVALLLCAGVASVVGAIVTLLNFAKLFNVWRWVGMFQPELWIIHKSLSAVSGS